MASRAPVCRTRFVCISDTHNQTPKLPQGDVLIHAGDLTNQGSYTELRKAVQWLEGLNFERKIVVAGNHDVTLDKSWFAQNQHHLRYSTPQNSDECLELLSNSDSITYLAHQSTTVRLTAPSGPNTTFKVFGSPYSPAQGNWAFGYEGEEDSARLWSSIPLDTDVVVTHTPPKGHCDEVPSPPRPGGCESLRRALWTVRPKLAVCGHRHFGRGVDRIQWTLDQPYLEYQEADRRPWIDTGAGHGNKKESRIDLSSRSLRPLRNTDTPVFDEANNIPLQDQKAQAGKLVTVNNDSTASARSARSEPYAYLELNQAAPPNSSSRIGRLETCIVNASYMASNYGAHKAFNKPIVVDLDLPRWQGSLDADGRS